MLKTLKTFLSGPLAGYLIMAGLFFGSLEAVNLRSCHSDIRAWTAINRVVDAAFNPPSQAGRKLTPQQQTALKGYRDDLAAANGAKPHCSWL